MKYIYSDNNKHPAINLDKLRTISTGYAVSSFYIKFSYKGGWETWDFKELNERDEYFIRIMDFHKGVNISKIQKL